MSTLRQLQPTKIFQLTTLTMALALAGCGGGGGTVDSIAPKPGGGSSVVSDNDKDGGSTNTIAPLNVSNISLVNKKTGANTNRITAEGAKAKVRVTDEKGMPVSRVLVTYSGTDIEIAGSANGGVLTDDEGYASATIYPVAGSASGGYSMIATAENGDESGTSASYYYELDSSGTSTTEPSVPVNVSTLSLIDTKTKKQTHSIVASGTLAKIRVTDKDDKPIANTPVTFSGTGIEVKGSANGTVLTDSNGYATATLVPTDGAVSGSYSLTAAAENNGNTATSASYYYNLEVTNPDGEVSAPINITNIVLYDKTTNEVTNTISSTGVVAEVTVTDADKKALSSALVSFSGNGIETVGSANGTVLTNAEGKAVVTLIPSSGATSGGYTMTATATATVQTVNGEEEKTATTASKYYELKADGTDVTLPEPVNVSTIELVTKGGKSTKEITSEGTIAKIKVTDENKNAIVSTLVTFKGTGIKVVGSANNSVLTDDKGYATAILVPMDNASSGSYSLTATAQKDDDTATSSALYYDLVVSDNTNDDITAPVNISNIDLTNKANNKATNIISATGAIAKVTVTNKEGKPISNTLVSFSGTNIEVVGSANSTVLTNKEGVATVTLIPSENATSGSYSLTATAEKDGDTATSASYYYQLNPENGQTDKVAAPVQFKDSGNGKTVRLVEDDYLTDTRTIDATNSVKVYASATVVDDKYKPIKNALVTFTGTGIDFVGTSNGAVLTNEKGIAKVQVTPSASAVSGGYELNASVVYKEDTATAASYYYQLKINDTVVEERADVNVSGLTLIATKAGNGTTHEVSSKNGATARVKVTDKKNKPIANTLVTFSGTGVNYVGTTDGSVLTDENGLASVELQPQPGAAAGSYGLTATAQYDGKSASSTPYYYTLDPSSTGDDVDDTVKQIQINTDKLLDIDQKVISVDDSIGLDGAFYQVTVTDQNDKPIQNVRVSFSINPANSGISLSNSTSGSIVTDAQGVAQMFFKPDSTNISGAYTISAVADYDGGLSASSDYVFSVTPTDVLLSALTAQSSDIASGSQTSVSFNVTDTDNKPLKGVLVNLSADCGQLPEQVTSDTDGSVEFVYKAINADNTLCSGPVTITATTGSSVSAYTTVTVAQPKATSIIYTTELLTMGIQNSGSSNTGKVQFTVYSNTTPLSNQDVTLSLEKSPQGLTFGELGNTGEVKAKTDENGIISVNIYPGSTAGAVEIKATLDSDVRINALSKGITVAGARVTQTGLSISWEKNVLDWSYDGDTAEVVARMVDRNGNSVPDDTVIYFTTEGGKVSPASCTTINGECTVTFSTQNPRPGDGRVSVLAIAEGEKDYIDANKNNAWDEGEKLVHNIGDTFRDDNENGSYDEGEFIYPLRTNSKDDCEEHLDTFVKLKFPIIYESPQKLKIYKKSYINSFVTPNSLNTCNSGLDAIVRSQRVTLLSDGGSMRLTPGYIKEFSNGSKSFIPVNIQDNILPISTIDNSIVFRMNSGGFYDFNPMPSGTTVSGSVKDNTNATPTAIVVNSNGRFAIQVIGANPNSTIKVNKGEAEYSVTTDDKGEGKTTEFETVPAGEISVLQENFSCKVKQSGDEKVDATVNTGSPGQNTGTYHAFAFSQCTPGDTFTYEATTPKGKSFKVVYTLK